jgi:hypothetical protein
MRLQVKRHDIWQSRQQRIGRAGPIHVRRKQNNLVVARITKPAREKPDPGWLPLIICQGQKIGVIHLCPCYRQVKAFNKCGQPIHFRVSC